MRAFVDPFNKLLAQSKSGVDARAQRRISALARFATHIWRAVIIMMIQDSDALAVPLRALVHPINRRADYMPVTDAANSLGVAIFNAQNVLVLMTSYKLPFEAFASDNQNAKEFMGLLLSIVLLKTLVNAPRGTTISLTNDNTSALSWIKDN